MSLKGRCLALLTLDLAVYCMVYIHKPQQTKHFDK